MFKFQIIKLLDGKRSQTVGILISSLHLEMKDIQQGESSPSLLSKLLIFAAFYCERFQTYKKLGCHNESYVSTAQLQNYRCTLISSEAPFLH